MYPSHIWNSKTGSAVVENTFSFVLFCSFDRRQKRKVVHMSLQGKVEQASIVIILIENKKKRETTSNKYKKIKKNERESVNKVYFDGSHSRKRCHACHLGG